MSSDLLWYAVRVKSQCENIVSEALRYKGYEEFLPQYWSRRLWSDRVKIIQKPLFAGYLFCRFDLEQRRSILETPGVFIIVGVGRKPLPVDSAEVESIRLAVNSGQPVSPWTGLMLGRNVRVEVGPLRGVEGTLLRFKGASRLVLEVRLLQRAVVVEVDEGWVVPIDREKPMGNLAPKPEQIDISGGAYGTDRFNGTVFDQSRRTAQ
jgi:transcription termination/antitermination protein NusG